MRRIGSLLARAILVVLFLLFAWANFAHWRATGKPSGLGTTVLEGWAALLFLVRRPADRLSLRLIAWVAAPIGSFAMLFARPAEGGLAALPCELLQLLGVLIAFVSLATLGRSFAEKANRAVGPVRICVPMNGFSVPNHPGGPFWDPDADRAFVAALEENLSPHVEVFLLDAHINDREFVDRVVDVLVELIGGRETEINEDVEVVQ